MPFRHTQPKSGLSIVLPGSSNVDVSLSDGVEFHRDGREESWVALATEGKPGSDFVASVQAIADVATPLTQVEFVVVVLVEVVITEAPSESAVEPLKEADGREALESFGSSFDPFEDLDGVVGVVGCRANLESEATGGNQGNAHVGVKASTEVGIDAEVLGLLGAFQSTKQGEVLQQHPAERLWTTGAAAVAAPRMPIHGITVA